MDASSSSSRSGAIFCCAPLYRSPKDPVGSAKRPNGMPPAKDAEAVFVEEEGGLPASGPKALVPSQAASVTRSAASRGAHRRAILRDSLKVYVMADTSSSEGGGV